MKPDDLTTPLDGLASHDLPTINRAPGSAGRTADAFAPGTLVGARYRIVALLGRGGMGAVYRADDLRLGQPVALKFVSLGDDQRSLENLYHEVRVARQVSHPNVCRVHDVVETDGHRFIAMEYVDGEDLASLLRRIGRLPPARATDVAREVAAGLAAAHDRGIIHRDLKPANVMIDGNGRAHVTDFGLASLAGTQDGQIAGTPAYMAPEQVLGQPVTPRSDVYALGLLMHELFTGERVYSAASYADRRSQRAIAPRPASDSVKEVDPAIDGLIAACLAEDPEQRPASARAVLALLPGGDAIDAAMAAGETPSPEMVAAASETGRLHARVAWTVFAVIVVALLSASLQSHSHVSLMRKPPEVFAERAEEIVATAGESVAAQDTVHFYDYDRMLLRSPLGLLPREQFSAIRPGILRFIYRRSPARMAPRETIDVSNDIFIFQSGRVTLTDPRLQVPGEAIVILDQHRGLVNYRARPSGRAATTDWAPLLAATGVELKTLVAETPAEVPPVASDAHVAWSGAYAGRPERVRIEAASLFGKPAWLQVYPSWETTRRGTPAGGWIGIVFSGQLVTMIIITIAALVVARRSWRQGRSDRAGAMRLALYLGGCLLVSWLIAAHHTHQAHDEARMIASGVGEAVASALIIWIYYTALEPGVRRMWPRALIGWTRLLSGRWRDSMVAREFLFGITGGIAAFYVFWITALIRDRLGRPSNFFVNVSALDPLRTFAGDHLISHVQMIEIPIGIMFASLLLTRLFGRRGAVAAFIVLVSSYSLVSPAVSLFLILMLLALLRSGLLTGVVMGATASLMMGTHLTLETGAWYWPRAAVVLLIVMAAALWSARVVVGRRAQTA